MAKGSKTVNFTHTTPRRTKKTSLAEQLAVDVAVEIDSLLGRGSSVGIDLEAIEIAARRQALGLAARAIEHSRD